MGKPMSPEAKAKWRESVRKTNDKPAMGKPASGIPASGLPAMGAGWGGDKLEGKPSRLLGLTGGDVPAMRRQVSREMEDVIYGVALNDDEYGGVRVQAAAKLHEIYNGKPVERVQVDDTPLVRDHIDPADLSLEARRELREALTRAQQRGVRE